MSRQQRLIKSIDQLRFNPSSAQRLMLRQIEKPDHEDKDILDPTNPFAFLMEASVINTLAFMNRDEILVRRQYPSMAQTQEELYLHMSDEDYVDRFASPAKDNLFSILLGVNDVRKKAVDTGVNNIRKVTIPRNSEFTVADHKFTMQYPVDIRIMNHGGIQVVYDVSVESPLKKLSSNVVDWQVVSIGGLEFLKIDVPVDQFEIDIHYAEVNRSSGFNRSFGFENQFYFARVYTANGQGGWSELHTTHSQQVYDPHEPTALLTVLEKELVVHVPQIYFSTDRIKREVRVDIYTTEGPIDVLLGNYGLDSFQARWIDHHGTEQSSQFNAPLSSFSNIAVFSDSVVSGGAGALSFQQLRRRVINNAIGASTLPITGAQLEASVEDRGYSLVKSVDNITDRIFLATRALPTPSDESSEVPMGVSMDTLETSFTELTERAGDGTVSINQEGRRVTIHPSMLFENDGGQIKIVNQADVDVILSRNNDVVVNEVNARKFLFTPFHYVLDRNEHQFNARAYYLNNPEIMARQFVSENDTTGLIISTRAHDIEKIHPQDNNGVGGYRLTVITRSGETVHEKQDDEIYAQLSFNPTGTSDRVYLTGEMVGRDDEDERIFEFFISTNYNIDDQHRISLGNFQPNEDTVSHYLSRMTETFDLVYIAKNHTATNMRSSDIDQLVGDFAIVGSTIGVTRERITTRFGYTLESLWTPSRSVIGSEQYERYNADVPYHYEETVYERDDITGNIIIDYDEQTGEISYNILHEAGDPVLDEYGNQVYKHREGDVKTNPDGTPIIKQGQRTMLRQIDVLFLDGRFFFATDGPSARYREEVPMVISEWLENDIGALNDRLLENTQLFFYPRNNLGNVSVIVREGIRSVMDAEQSIDVWFYLTGEGYNDPDMIETIENNAREIIVDKLSESVVSRSDIISKLKATSGDEVIAINMQGLGGDNNYNVVSIWDDSDSLTLRKRLSVTADNNLTVVDDININFIMHA